MIEALSNPGTMIMLLLLALALIGGAKAWRMRLEWALFQQWRQDGMPMAHHGQATPITSVATATAHLDSTPLAGADHALKNPPSDFRTLVAAVRAKGNEPYRVPLGWHTGGLVTARLTDDVNHVLITGQTDAGKDNAVMGMFLSLAAVHNPQQAQFCIIDGKGLGWQKWAKKAHTWRLALDPEEIAGTMAALVTERQRRKTILQAADVEKWDEYQGDDIPLLVVFVSELLLLENAVGSKALTSWLNTELTAARAFGIRYLLATQTASNFDTQWRSQISLFLAGFQPTPTQDKPNTGMSTAELEALGGLPPSKLPSPSSGAAGVFTAIQGRDIATVRTSYLSGQHRTWVLSTLPDRTDRLPVIAQPATPPTTQTVAKTIDDTALLALLHSGAPLPFVNESSSAAIAHSNGIKAESVAPVAPSSGSGILSVDDTNSPLVVAADIVPADEQRRILAAAQAATSRRQVSLKLYESTGGQKYTWVQVVCDAAGLLPTQKAA